MITDTFIDANGQHWRVSRQWTARRSRIREKLRFRKPTRNELDAIDFLDLSIFTADSLVGIAAGIAFVVVLGILFVILVAVLLPLIGVVFEIALVMAFLSTGALGRVLTLRPWIIDAVNLDNPARSRQFATKGWVRSRRVIDEIKTSLTSSGALPLTIEPTPVRTAE